MKILVVDDDLEFIDHLKFLLADSFTVVSADTPAKAEEILSAGEIEAVLLDIDLKADISGLDMLSKIRSEGNNIPVIMVSGTTSVETVVSAMKHGADDYIGKTVKVEELKASIFRALTNAKQKRELSYLRSELAEIKGQLYGESEGIKKIRETVSVVAETDSPVLICGESGTGKELVARFIHNDSSRKNGAFVAVNCAAIPKELFESEFFGHEKGAFTGAVSTQIGKLELADGGTLFLDEIGELPLNMQAKFLRVLQEKRFARLGLAKEIVSNFRLVSATNRDISKLIENGEFRDDLFFRINVVQINIPPLRERRDDIPSLAKLILAKKCKEMNRQIPQLSPEVLNLLISYNWSKNNVRELENVIECTLIFCRKNVIEPVDIKGISLSGQSELPDYETGKKDVLEKYQKDYIELSLNIYERNITKTAKSMGLSRQGLYNLMKKLELDG